MLPLKVGQNTAICTAAEVTGFFSAGVVEVEEVMEVLVLVVVEMVAGGGR